MGKKIINGIEVNTNLKRKRVILESQTSCHSTISSSSPDYYWQFENIESDFSILTVEGTHPLKPVDNTYGELVNGVDNTNALYPKILGGGSSSGGSFGCSSGSLNKYSTVIPEYSSSVPETLTFEFFYTFEPNKLTLLKFGNIYDDADSGFEIKIDNEFSLATGSYSVSGGTSGIVVTVYKKTSGTVTESSKYYEDYDIPRNQYRHVVLEVDDKMNASRLYIDKNVILTVDMEVNTFVANNKSAYLEILKEAPPETKEKLFYTASCPVPAASENWENFYRGTRQYGDYTLSPLILRNGVYVIPITYNTEKIVPFDYEQYNSYLGFGNNRPDKLQLAFQYDDLNNMDSVSVNIKYQYSTDYINFYSWEMPFDPNNIPADSCIGLETPLKTADIAGNIESIVVSQSYYATYYLTDIIFCSNGSRVFPTSEKYN